ncbi:heparan-alpha-glucosaminide N-acetyltransferase domain-containing protein [Lysobacter sp. TLK-CK17T]|uniref:Heparan-alpha-glucosaminide N-acetyltransferase domain-containing protein n=2 Tax=Marilutibacter chinensis TaxID=2912247 RepID=A0ABS9HUW3_9GAMM|nr:heparan-alpha-glucosaminide N-acetyltransferase domain-containing protein [Lysobacter chinensis]
MLLVNNPGDWGHVYAPLLHADWHGFTPTDLIFPLFLFIVGVSLSLALGRQLEKGVAAGVLLPAVLGRAARIVGLGLFLHLCAWWAFDLEHYRVMGVLQRIGLCYLAAAVVALWLPARLQWVLLATLLAGYATLLAAGGSLEPFANIASRVDTRVLGEHLYRYDAGSGQGHDPEGIVSTLGALASTVLGLRAGDWLRRGRGLRVGWAAPVLLVLGAVWAPWLPWNKNLWTPSYVLWCGGLACALLALCHWLVDLRGWPPLGRAFGVNAIAAYAGSAFMLYGLAAAGWLEPVYRHVFAGWMTPRFGPYLPSLAHALAFVAVWWAVVRWLDARRIHFKV